MVSFFTNITFAPTFSFKVYEVGYSSEGNQPDTDALYSRMSPGNFWSLSQLYPFALRLCVVSMMDSLDESLANITMAIIATRGKDDLLKYMVAMGQAFIDLGMAIAKTIMRNYELRIL